MSGSGIHLDSFQDSVATYVGRHQSLETKAILEFKVHVAKRHPSGKWVASVDFDGCEGETVKSAMLRLSDWLGRAAETLDQDDGWWGDGAIPLGNEFK